MTSNDPSGRRIHVLLEERMSNEPPPPPISDLMTQIQRDRRHRTRLTIAACGAAVLVASLAPIGITKVVDAADNDQPANHSDTQPRSVVDQCNRGNQSPGTTALFNRSGVPREVAQTRVADTSTVVLESADGTMWADCFINHAPSAEFPSGMDVYSSTRTQDDIHYGSGMTCTDAYAADPQPCDRFMVDYVDRLPEDVHAARFETADGASTRVTTTDGYLVFSYTGTVPASYSEVDDPPQQWLLQVTYLNRNDVAIAAQRLGSSDPERQRVGSLPLLSAFPGLHADVKTDQGTS